MCMTSIRNFDLFIFRSLVGVEFALHLDFSERILNERFIIYHLKLLNCLKKRNISSRLKTKKVVKKIKKMFFEIFC